jgi:NADPH:quinone reductase-like Zn-dependent oxidoreductase
VQIAKSLGAEVTGVDSTAKLDTVLSIGADRVVDFTKEDFTKTGETYDVIIDAVSKASLSRCIGSLTEKGIFLGGPGLSRLILGPWTSMTSSKKAIIWTGTYEIEDLIFLKELIEAGKIMSIIDRRYPLEQIAEAHRYVDTGQKIGNVVLTVGT